ncbi:MAG: RsmE family RNA methyltransferase [Actinobacteria bacterium]|nr:RsmE family RNA methyltransferase [Actinomycetota bacterium]
MTGREGYAAAADATALVFVPSVVVDGALEIEGMDGHHLARVRRIEVGERVVVADGRGLWRRCVVVAVHDGALRLEPEHEPRHEPQAEPRLAVAFAPAKADGAATVVRQLVELGVNRVIPILTRRGVVRWQGARADRVLDRLTRIAAEAAARAHRALLPAVEPAVELTALAGHPGLVLADPDGVRASEISDPPGGEWLVVIGPEGGLDETEIAALHPWRRLAVGPYTLRSVTAPTAVAAALAGSRRW